MGKIIQIELDEEIFRQLKELHKTEYFAGYSYQGMVHELLETGLMQCAPDKLAEQLHEQEKFCKWRDDIADSIFEGANQILKICYRVKEASPKYQISKRITLPVQWHED